MQGLLVGLTRRRRGVLAHPQLIGLSRRIIMPGEGQFRRTGLGVPASELAQVAAARRLHAGQEVVGGHRFPIVAGEIEVGGAAEQLGPEQGRQHAHQLRPLLVDGGGVEVVDLDVGIRANRVGQGAGVLGELTGAQHPHVGDALDAPGAAVGGEFLIAEDGEALLQAQLEPIAAGDAVAGPVVEVLVGDDPLHPLEVQVGGGVRAGQDRLGVEDVEPLVLHGAHVEVADGDDVVDLQVILPAVAVLVPAHGVLEGGHGVAALGQVFRLHPDVEGDLAARGGAEAIRDPAQVPGHQGEEVRGLGEGIDPARSVAAVRQVLGAGGVAVGQQHRVQVLVRLQGDGIAGHDIRAVEEIGDAAETLGLALGAEHALGEVEPFQAGIVRGADAHPGLQATMLGHPEEGQAATIDGILVGT